MRTQNGRSKRPRNAVQILNFVGKYFYKRVPQVNEDQLRFVLNRLKKRRSLDLSPKYISVIKPIINTAKKEIEELIKLGETHFYGFKLYELRNFFEYISQRWRL